MIVPRGFTPRPGTLLPVDHIRIVMDAGSHYDYRKQRPVQGHDHVHVNIDYDELKKTRVWVCRSDLASCEPALAQMWETHGSRVRQVLRAAYASRNRWRKLCATTAAGEGLGVSHG